MQMADESCRHSPKLSLAQDQGRRRSVHEHRFEMFLERMRHYSCRVGVIIKQEYD